MLKSVELKKELETLKNNIAALKAENKIEEAHAKLGELKELQNKIKEAELEESLAAKETKNKGGVVDMGKEINVNAVFNKLLMGKSVTNEEMEAYRNSVGTPGQVEATDEKGGYLVPKQQETEIYEYRRSLISLKNYCDVVPVSTLSGTFPVEVLSDDELIAFDELNEITQHDVSFAQKFWKVKDYADIIPISNTLLADEKANLVKYIGRRFAKKSVNTENKPIIEIMKGVDKKTGDNFTTIDEILNVHLDPAISATSVIFTNQTSFNWLDTLLDGEGRPLLQPSLTNSTQKTYKGRPIVTLPDAKLQKTKSKMEFWVGDLSLLVKFFDREGLEMASSTEAGFTKNATLLRVIERFDVQKIDDKAMFLAEITPKVKA